MRPTFTAGKLFPIMAIRGSPRCGTLVATSLDLVILQAGVGAMAAAPPLTSALGAARTFRRFACVQPVSSDCLVESAFSENGEPRKTTGAQDRWPVLRASVTLFLSIEDRFAEQALRWLYYPVDGGRTTLITRGSTRTELVKFSGGPRRERASGVKRGDMLRKSVL